MFSLRPQDPKSLCRFTFADGRQCRSLRSVDHPDFCFDRGRKDSQAPAADPSERQPTNHPCPNSFSCNT